MSRLPVFSNITSPTYVSPRLPAFSNITSPTYVSPRLPVFSELTRPGHEEENRLPIFKEITTPGYVSRLGGKRRRSKRMRKGKNSKRK